MSRRVRDRWHPPARYLADIRSARFAPHATADGERFCASPGCDRPPVVAAGDVQHSRDSDAVVATELYFCDQHARYFADAHDLTVPGPGL